MGRPTDFKPEYCDLAENYSMLGATDKEMAGFFDVTEQTLNNWKKKHPEFFESLKKGKAEADGMVVKSLFKRALGYEAPEDKIFNDSGRPMVVPTIKHHPPDTTAAIFWLKNRRPDDWRDKREIENSGSMDFVVTDEPMSEDDWESEYGNED